MPPESEPVRAWLFGLQRFGMRPGLDNIRALLGALDNPERRYRTALVAGTNGKGSTSSVLAAALSAAGRRVGLYTSPHLVHLRERVVLTGRPVADEVLDRALLRVRPFAERIGSTFFEVMTATALLAFAEAEVEDAVLEVGLGGRFDATNVVSPALSLITGVALDHVDVLGADLRSIAREKAGILRPGVPAATAASDDARSALAAAAEDQGVELRMLAEGADYRVRNRGWSGIDLELRLDGQWVPLRSPMVGRHQAGNVALAAFGAWTLGAPTGALKEAVAKVAWPGRLERIAYHGRYVVLDGAHNPDSATALAKALQRLEGRVPLMIVGMSADKDIESVGQALGQVADHLLATRTRTSPRALAPEELALRLPADIVRPDLSSALEAAIRRVPEGGTIVIAGSLFLVGEARALLLGMPEERMPREQ